MRRAENQMGFYGFANMNFTSLNTCLCGVKTFRPTDISPHEHFAPWKDVSPMGISPQRRFAPDDLPQKQFAPRTLLI